MTNPDQEQEQELIGMIAKATPETTVNEDHRERLRQQALDAYDHRESDTDPGHKPLFTFTGATFMKIAASITLFAAAGFFAITALSPSKAIAFEDVAREILKIESASFEITSTIQYADGATEDEGPYKCMTKLPALMRAEMPEGDTLIIDFAKDKMLIIDPKEKTAMVLDDFVDFAEDDNVQKNLFGEIQEHLRNAEQGGEFGEITYEKLGKKQINEASTVGFRVLNPDADIEDFEGDSMSFNVLDIWADSKTGVPVHLEFTLNLEDGSQVKSTFNNFVYNQKLNPQLFSFAAPEGYELIEANNLSQFGRIFGEEGELGQEAEKLADQLAEQIEENIGSYVEELANQRASRDDVISALRAYAQHTGGKLPDTLDSGPMIDAMMEAWEKDNPNKPLFKDDDSFGFTDQQLDKDMQTIVQASAYLQTLELSGGSYTYRGKGVKVNVEPTPVLWLQSKGATAYTVVYNDFSVRDTNQGPDDR